MSINITSNGTVSTNPALNIHSPELKPGVEPRPRDEKGRFKSFYKASKEKEAASNKDSGYRVYGKNCYLDSWFKDADKAILDAWHHGAACVVSVKTNSVIWDGTDPDNLSLVPSAIRATLVEKRKIMKERQEKGKKEVEAKKPLKSLYMEEIESTTPYIYNFVKDNGVVKAMIHDRDVNACLYLNKGTESYYLFFTHHNSFGFHLSCGVLVEVLNNEDTVKLSTEHEILYWDSIQKV